MNPKRLRGLPTVVKRFIYAHECGHQTVGRDESAADCFAVARGFREKWIQGQDLNKICRFCASSRGRRCICPGKSAAN